MHGFAGLASAASPPPSPPQAAPAPQRRAPCRRVCVRTGHWAVLLACTYALGIGFIVSLGPELPRSSSTAPPLPADVGAGFFTVWNVAEGAPFAVSDKLRISLLAFAREMPDQQLALYTRSEPADVKRGLSRAGILSARGRRWPGKELLIVSYELRPLVHQCAAEAGLRDRALVRQALSWIHTAASPDIAGHTAGADDLAHESDVVRACVAYLHGGFYFDTDLLLLQPFPDLWLRQDAVLFTGPKCDTPSPAYFYTPCTSLPGWSYEKARPSGVRDPMPEPPQGFVQNGLFAFWRPRARFLQVALRSCLGQRHETNCWNCCGPRAFSYALNRTVSRGEYRGVSGAGANTSRGDAGGSGSPLALISDGNTLDCGLVTESIAGSHRMPMATARVLVTRCISVHIWGGAGGRWAPKAGSLLEEHCLSLERWAAERAANASATAPPSVRNVRHI